MAALPQTISPTIAAIEAAVVAAETRDFDHVIRGSSIGHPCERHLWYRFRWAREPEAFDGRKLRLFHTGHAEEVRMVAWLRLAGVEVQAVDPETGEQWEVVALDGHFKGHLDGIATGVFEAPVTPHLLECKTHNTRSFEQLKKHGVAVSKPEHVAQMQIYMHLKGLTRAFYLAKHKDSDELYAERIRYDAAQAVALLAKAGRVRDANHAPARISDDPDFFQCRWCSSHAICHGGGWALRNCRTCLASTPVAGGQWKCERFDRILSIEDQKAGCSSQLFLPSLVQGEQTDADETTVTYAMPDGSMWVDGHDGTGGTHVTER
jgi:hypothetical protein